MFFIYAPFTRKLKNYMFDVLIIGGGAAGMSCALVLSSAKNKPFASNKKIGIFMHQKASALRNGLFNNVLGMKPGTTGKEILENGKQQLHETCAHIKQIEGEKVTEGIYVAGILAGWRSQFAIASGSGVHVAIDILTSWNNGNPTMIHKTISSSI